MRSENLIRIVLILLGVMWLSIIQSFSQDTWTQKTSVGTFGRANAVGFSIGDKGYIGTGYDENGVAQKDFWEFDPVTNSWTQKADLPGQTRFNATGFGIGDKGYLGSGQPGNTFNWPPLRDFYEYDPATNVWTSIMDFPRDAYYLLSFVIGSKAYVGTGNGDAQDFWEYDPVINNWIRKADLPGLGRNVGFAFTIGDKGYIGSGRYETGGFDPVLMFLSDFWQYTPATDSWVKKADLPVQMIRSGFGIDTRGYITASPDKVWQYDLPTDTWISKNNSAAVDRFGGVSFVIAEKGYIGLGFQTPTGYLNDFWEYTPSPAVTIESFNPSSGSTSSPVTITGINFSATPANNLVKFNGTTAVVTASTTTSITTTVPVGATSGPITVTVSGSTATSSTNFILTDDQNFITNWNLNGAGSGPTEISFGTATSGTVNYTWQEIFGTATGSGSWSGSNLTITGLPAGSFIRLQIEPTNFQRIIMAGSADAFSRLIRVEQWGSTAWTSMEQAFSDCYSLFEITATDMPNL